MRISYWSSDVCSSDLGYIGVEPQDSSDLIEKSSREGFEENGAFLRLRRLVQRLFAEAVEPRRQTFRESAGLSRKRSTTFDEVRKLSEMEKIRELIVRFPPDERAKAEQVKIGRASCRERVCQYV